MRNISRILASSSGVRSNRSVLLATLQLGIATSLVHAVGGQDAGRSFSVGADGSQTSSRGNQSPRQEETFCQLLKFPGINKSAAIKPDQLKGKIVMVVNTASLCGYTPQLAKLQELHDRYKERGFTVLAVPSNDFGAQEPWEEDKVQEFYTSKYGVTFPITAKTSVLGGNIHPAFSWIQRTLGDAGAPHWNFQKWLVGRSGNLIALFSPDTDPLADEITRAIEEEFAWPTK